VGSGWKHGVTGEDSTAHESFDKYRCRVGRVTMSRHKFFTDTIEGARDKSVDVD
jgi:hypothetical protein